jgi:hypothetical protein
MPRCRAMNERLPHDVRKLALLARQKCQKRLLSETDQLLRNSRGLVNRTLKLIREDHGPELQPRKGNGAA